MPMSMIRELMRREASGGIVLMVSALAAIIVANSPLYMWYDSFFNMYFQIGLARGPDVPTDIFGLSKPLILWINDGLMALFFLLVGLEIKREFVAGELSSVNKAMLPVIAAIGGVIVPVIIFCAFNFRHPEYMKAWAVPAATDIAFALGIIAILKSRVPLILKVLLTALAIMDDLLAIVVIAVFYTDAVSHTALLLSFGFIAILWLMNRRGITALDGYLFVGLLLWAAVLKSGVHATLAGVITALFIPMHGKAGISDSPVQILEHRLNPWIAFAVVPIFGFANAGVRFIGIGPDDINVLTIGVAAGLFFGKQLGIFSAIFIAVKSGFVPMLKDTSWKQIYGISVLGGIGFTMSLFIGDLALDTAGEINSLRIGIIVGSVASAVTGYIVLRTACVTKITVEERDRAYHAVESINKH